MLLVLVVEVVVVLSLMSSCELLVASPLQRNLRYLVEICPFRWIIVDV